MKANLMGIRIFISIITLFILVHQTFIFSLAQNDIEDPSEIMKALRDENHLIRQGAVLKLGTIRPVTEEIISMLIQALEDESEEVRRVAVRSAENIGPPAKEALPILRSALLDKSKGSLMRIGIPNALIKIDPRSAETVRVLTHVMEDKKDDLLTRVNATVALGNLGDSAREALPSLIKLAREEESHILQIEAWLAVANIRPENQEAIQMLVKVAQGEFGDNIAVNLGVHSTGFPIRIQALETLFKLGETKRFSPY